MLLRARRIATRVPCECYHHANPTPLTTLHCRRAQADFGTKPRSSFLSYIQAQQEKSNKYAPYIDTESLQRTLEAHREANRAGLIRYWRKDGKSHSVDAPSIPKTLDEHDQEARQLQDPPVTLRFSDSKSSPDITIRKHYSARKGTLVQPNDQVQSKQLNVQPKTQDTLLNGQPLTKTNTTLKEPKRALLLIWDWGRTPWLPVNKQHPWLAFMSKEKAESSHSAMNMLTAEMYAFEQYMTPTQEEEDACDYAVLDMARVFKHIDSELRFEVIGSRATGLAMPFSDVDINIIAQNGSRLDDVEERAQAVISLKSLYKRLRELRHPSPPDVPLNLFRPLVCLDHARVPVTVAIHKRTGLQFQFQQTVTGFNTGQYAQSFKAEYPTLHTLFFVIKHMLKIRGLTDGALGGISSYPLLNMIVASLKLAEEKVRSDDVAGQLLFFLEFYSKIDMDTTGLSVLPLEYINMGLSEPTDSPPQEENATTVSSPISSLADKAGGPKARARQATKSNRKLRDSFYLRDPADPSNDLGRSAKLFRDVQECFTYFREALQASIQEWDDYRSRKPPWKKQVSILQACLRADYTFYDLERQTLAAYASQRKAELESKS